MKKLALAVVIILLIASIPLIAQTRPAFAIEDEWEMGCVSCHSPQVMGQTLDAALDELDHPDIRRVVTTLPDGCTMCHRDGELGPLVHRVHYAAGGADDAPTMACLSCHTMNSVRGRAENKSAPKNW